MNFICTCYFQPTPIPLATPTTALLAAPTSTTEEITDNNKNVKIESYTDKRNEGTRHNESALRWMDINNEEDDDVVVETYGDKRSSAKQQNEVFMVARPNRLNDKKISRQKTHEQQLEYVDSLVDDPIIVKKRRVVKVNRESAIRERRFSDGDEVVLKKIRSIKHKSRSPTRKHVKEIKNFPISLRIKDDSTRTKLGKKQAKLIYKEPSFQSRRKEVIKVRPSRKKQDFSIAKSGYFGDGFDDVVMVEERRGRRRGRSEERTIRGMRKGWNSGLSLIHI